MSLQSQAIDIIKNYGKEHDIEGFIETVQAMKFNAHLSQDERSAVDLIMAAGRRMVAPVEEPI